MLSNKPPKTKNAANLLLPSLFQSLILLLIGGPIVGVLLWINSQQLAFARIARTTDGTVVELIEQYDSNSINKSYAPKIEFLTENKQIFFYTSPTYFRPSRYSVGDTVNILYNPEKPQEAVIASDNAFFTNPLMIAFGVTGLLLLSLGAYSLTSHLLARSHEMAA